MWTCCRLAGGCVDTLRVDPGERQGVGGQIMRVDSQRSLPVFGVCLAVFNLRRSANLD